MGYLTCFGFWTAAALIAFKLWQKLTTVWCKSYVTLVGKTAIITGSNTGLGYQTASDFAKRGAKVILACRDRNRGEEARRRLTEETDNPNIFYRHLDLASFRSVWEFSEDINKSEERLDILVNNAGVITGSEITEDGLLLLMQVNYFGHFLLTNLLLDLLKRTPNSRVVNVAARSAQYARSLDVHNLNQPSSGSFFSAMQVAARSKLCNVLFTIELARKLRNTSVTSYSLCPGAVNTDVFRTCPPFMKFLIYYVLSWFSKSPQEGAQTTIYCAVEKDIEFLSGQHFQDCHLVERYQTAQDFDLSSKLWEISEELVKLKEKL